MHNERTSPPAQDRLLTAREVCGLLGVGRTSLWKLRKVGQVPEPVRLGGMARWPASEIRAVIAKAAADRDSQAGAAG